MKKISIILFILIVLIAAWLGAAWYTGTRIEAQTGNALEPINAYMASNQQATLGAQMKQVSYERGLLSSHARYAITSNLLNHAPLGEMDVTFWHGPFPLAALRSGNFAPQQYQLHMELLASAGPLQTMVGTATNGKPPLVADIGCNFSKHCAITSSVPPINADLGANAKLTFGGIQMQFNLDHQSDTVYKTSGQAQLLPLSIGGQNFGSGQITIEGDAQSVTQAISWKTDQGASKLTFALTTSQPIPYWGDPALTAETLPRLIKTASAKLELSKPMVVDLAARVLNLTKGTDLAAARQQVDAQIDAMLAVMPAEMGKVIQTQNNLLATDWQYADGKLLINGQDNPEILEQIKQGYLRALHAREEAAAHAALPQDDSETAAASAPEPAASDDQ